MSSEPPLTLRQTLTRVIVGFPKYILEWSLGLLIVVLSDLHITTLAVTGLFIGLAASSVLVGIAAFLVAYTVSRIVYDLAEGFVVGTGQISRAINFYTNQRNG